MTFRQLLITTFIASSFYVSAQTNHRIEGTFSTKQKVRGEEESSLISGRFYYDINQGNLLYKLTFPEPQIWLFKDTTLYIVENKKISKKLPSPVPKQFNFFQLLLSGDLNYYGLKDSPYKIDDVKKDGDLVITVWTPPKEVKSKMGNVAISTKDKKLYGVIFYKPDGSILRKQLFSKYEFIKGVNIPTRVIDIFYKDDKEIIQESNYTKILINESSNLHYYRYMLPSNN